MQKPEGLAYPPARSKKATRASSFEGDYTTRASVLSSENVWLFLNFSTYVHHRLAKTFPPCPPRNGTGRRLTPTDQIVSLEPGTGFGLST